MTTRPLDRRALIDWFYRELCKAQLERSARPGMTDAGEPEWVVFEREKLLELINLRRAKLGKLAVSMDSVEQVENFAVGHFDYTKKLALGAADLALNEGGDTQ